MSTAPLKLQIKPQKLFQLLLHQEMVIALKELLPELVMQIQMFDFIK